MKNESSQLCQKLEKIRQQLITELDQLEADDIYERGLQPGSIFGRVDEAADSASNFERRLALQGQKRNSLANIERALEKVAQGSHGVCDTCNQPIESNRLEALPYTSYCLACAANRRAPVFK